MDSKHAQKNVTFVLDFNFSSMNINDYILC